MRNGVRKVSSTQLANSGWRWHRANSGWRWHRHDFLSVLWMSFLLLALKSYSCIFKALIYVKIVLPRVQSTCHRHPKVGRHVIIVLWLFFSEKRTFETSRLLKKKTGWPKTNWNHNLWNTGRIIDDLLLYSSIGDTNPPPVLYIKTHWHVNYAQKQPGLVRAYSSSAFSVSLLKEVKSYSWLLWVVRIS